VRPVVCAQFGEDVFHVTFDGFLGDGKLSGNLLVRISPGDQVKYTDFPRGSRHRRWHEVVQVGVPALPVASSLFLPPSLYSSVAPSSADHRRAKRRHSSLQA
jgi:hypothetical protein